ncbi:MAG TPA: AAA family ATPase [Deltaproteobacteria bacterium]|nr:AAA family ATPase [Deltaproteobacteria bacterium]
MAAINGKGKKTAEEPSTDDWSFVEALLASRAARTVYLWGPPGTGKSFTACTSGLEGREVFSVSLTPETPAAELRGLWMPKGDRFVWQDGVFVEAMRRGARIVINEISHASYDVLAILHPVLESRETARLTLPDLQTVSPAEGFQVVCTDNEPPDQLPAALRDRFDCVLRVGRPHPKALERLSEDFRQSALRTFDLEEDRAISVRGWLAVQEIEKELGREAAFRAVFGVERGEQLLRASALGHA